VIIPTLMLKIKAPTVLTSFKSSATLQCPLTAAPYQDFICIVFTAGTSQSESLLDGNFSWPAIYATVASQKAIALL
jgi:hypothetical protein